METPARLEPCFLETIPPEITDLIAALSSSAARLGSRLTPKTSASLAELVRVMNCYYSNLIEGHNTTPREIEHAMEQQPDSSSERRNLLIEARAHISLQRNIDHLYNANQLEEPAEISFIQFLHKRFYNDATESMLQIQGPKKIILMQPGEFRSSPDHEVLVGRHMPPSYDVLPDFMAYFEKRYRLAHLGQGNRIIAMAAAHHRFNFIHPFLDGNGRVSRLMSHAMALHAGIGAHGLWSVSRGLARGLNSRLEYKQMMDYADSPCQGDLDGRGNLSLKTFIEFISWFLKICLDQIQFMEGLFELGSLRTRLKHYCDQQGFRPEAFTILETVLLLGEIPRGDISRISGLKTRTASDLLSQLIHNGILRSETPKGAVFLSFPIASAEILFPKLFPVA